MKRTPNPDLAPTCHPERSLYARGLCNSCYQTMRRREKQATEHPDIPVKPQKTEAEKVIGDVSNPKVAEYVATAAIKNQMDMQRAVKEIAPTLSPSKAAEVADSLEKNPAVQESIQRALEADGLDEHSRDVYVRRIWDWFLNGNKDQQLTAARILQRAFIAEKVDPNRPQELVIRNYAEGVEKMFSSVDVDLGEEVDASS